MNFIFIEYSTTALYIFLFAQSNFCIRKNKLKDLFIQHRGHKLLFQLGLSTLNYEGTFNFNP